MLQAFRHGNRISALAYGPDGQRMATAADGVVRLWDVASGLEVLTIDRTSVPIHALAFNPDGRRLVAIDGNGATTVWNGSPIDSDAPVRLPAAPANPN